MTKKEGDKEKVVEVTKEYTKTIVKNPGKKGASKKTTHKKTTSRKGTGRKKASKKKATRKKTTRKKTARKKGTRRKAPPRKPRTSPTEKALIENFISLQKVMVNMAKKQDDLTNKISKLLELFEISAKTLAEKEFDIKKEKEHEEKIVEKLENVLDQNKTIARGLTLMHKKTIEGPQAQLHQMQNQIQQLPTLPPIPRKVIPVQQQLQSLRKQPLVQEQPGSPPNSGNQELSSTDEKNINIKDYQKSISTKSLD